MTANYPVGQNGNSVRMPSSGVTYIEPIALALHVLDFSGVMEAAGARLRLSVEKAEELTSVYVQRSADGIVFDDWRRVETSRDAKGTQRLSVLDEAPFATTYYRAKLVERSGAETFSAVVTLRRAADASAWTIHPTVTSGVLHLQSAVAGKKADFIITDMMGRTAQSGRLSGGALDVSSLAPGGYFLRIAGTTPATLRFFKQ